VKAKAVGVESLW